MKVVAIEGLDLAVIESRWWDGDNTSVRGLFDMLAGLHCGNPYAYHYEMFSSGESLQGVIERVAGNRGIRNIYIAAHGSDTGISGPEGRISRTKVANMLEDIHGNSLQGLFFGCCSFGKQVEHLGNKASLTWIAGYTKEIDWLDAAATDLYFWNAYYQSSVPEAEKKADRAKKMEFLLGVLRSRVPHMFEELGFQVAVSRRKGAVLTFPDDWDEGSLNHLKVDADEFICEHPGGWP